MLKPMFRSNGSGPLAALCLFGLAVSGAGAHQEAKRHHSERETPFSWTDVSPAPAAGVGDLAMSVAIDDDGVAVAGTRDLFGQPRMNVRYSDARSGKLRWEREIAADDPEYFPGQGASEGVIRQAYVNQVVTSGELVFVIGSALLRHGDYDDPSAAYDHDWTVLAFDKDTGELRWVTVLRGNTQRSANDWANFAVVAGHKLIVGGSLAELVERQDADGRSSTVPEDHAALVALSTTTGQELWRATQQVGQSYADNAGISGDLVLSYSDGQTQQDPSWHGTVIARRLSDGHEVWVQESVPWVGDWNALAVSDGRVFVAEEHWGEYTDGADGAFWVRAFDARSGDERWSEPVDAKPGQVESPFATAYAIAAADGVVVTTGRAKLSSGLHDLLVQGRDARSGALLWSTPVEDGHRRIGHAVKIAGGVAYVLSVDLASMSLALGAYDLKTGDRRGASTQPGSVGTSYFMDYHPFDALAVGERSVAVAGYTVNPALDRPIGSPISSLALSVSRASLVGKQQGGEHAEK